VQRRQRCAENVPGSGDGRHNRDRLRRVWRRDSFVLKDGDERYKIFISSKVDYGFPLAHLNAHRASGEPVKVDIEERNGRPVALTIEDA
jgi:hypothetical protein